MEKQTLKALEFLKKTVTVHIDRPLGTRHPKWGFYYPVNYGFIPGVLSGDGEELDVYVLGVHEALEQFEGQCIAVIHRLEEEDDKLVVVPPGKNYSNEAIRALTEFQEQFFSSVILRGPQRQVLAVPRSELQRQFELNTRQDIKLIVPALLDQVSAASLAQTGRLVKAEVELNQVSWSHSPVDQPNQVCLASCFNLPGLEASYGPLAIAFAQPGAHQDLHYHRQQTELFYSEHPLQARYRLPERKAELLTLDLPQGGLLLFGPGVVHQVELAGLTLVVALPAVIDDKFIETSA